MTGKQRAFIDFYLGSANFNASLAARLSGYKAASAHAYEAIGSENLQRPGIAAKIAEHFQQASVSAAEVLQELAALARGSSRDKIKALSLLAAHHGLLSPGWRQDPSAPVTISVVYEQGSVKNISPRLNGRQPPEEEKLAVEVQVIPPQRRLAPAPVEAMLAEVVDTEAQKPARCRHGNLGGECRVIDVGRDCPHWYRNSNKSTSGYRYA